MKDFVKNLTSDEVEELMYQLSRSGKVIIPQYYTPEHVNELTDIVVTENLMFQIQENFENDDTLMEIIGEKLSIFSQD